MKIWAVRENSTIQRDYVVPPASPVDFDIHNLDEKIAFSNMIDDESQKKINNHKENEKHIQNFEYKENIEYKQNFEYTENFEYKENKENIGNKSDRRRSNKGIVSLKLKINQNVNVVFKWSHSILFVGMWFLQKLQ